MNASIEQILAILGEEVVKNHLLQQEAKLLQAVIKEWAKDDETGAGDADTQP